MLCDGGSRFTKQGSHLRLRKPHGFFLQPHNYFDVAIQGLVNEYFLVPSELCFSDPLTARELLNSFGRVF